MSCPHCPHCQKLEGEKGGLSLLSGSDSGSETGSDQIETPKNKVRGKAREYSQAYEIAWKAYGRKEQKFEAFAVWLVRAKEVGGEPKLLTLILAALKWQGAIWAADGWRFAPYFERYLKRRKWDDEPMPVVAVVRAPSKFEPIAVRAEREREERRIADAEERIFGKGSR